MREYKEEIQLNKADTSNLNMVISGSNNLSLEIARLLEHVQNGASNESVIERLEYLKEYSHKIAYELRNTVYKAVETKRLSTDGKPVYQYLGADGYIRVG